MRPEYETEEYPVPREVAICPECAGDLTLEVKGLSEDDDEFDAWDVFCTKEFDRDEPHLKDPDEWDATVRAVIECAVNEWGLKIHYEEDEADGV